MILNINQKFSDLEISYFTSDGNKKIEKFPANNQETWRICSETDPKKSDKFKNWDGKPVKRVPTKRMNKFDIYEFIETLPTDYKKEITAVNFPKMYSVDIEVEVIDGFPTPEKAAQRVTTIAVATDDLKVIVLGWQSLTAGAQAKIQADIDAHFKKLGLTFQFQYKKFETEFDMMYTFFAQMIPKMPLVTGWNWDNFDWVYLYNRAIKLGIKPEIASPTGEIMYKTIIPMHVGMIDYMDIYKRYDRTVSPKENHSLDMAGTQVLDINKIKYDGTLQDLLEKDYDKYVFYNAVDAALVTLIHRKLKTVNSILSVAALNNLTIYKASSAVNLTEALLFKKLYANNRVIANDFKPYEGDTDYDGAYVKQPKPGLYNGIACFDFASLYPSVMRQMEISPESYVKKINSPEEIEKTRRENKDVIVTSSGAVFKSNETSILKKILTELYDERKVFKKRHLFLEIEISKLEKEYLNK